MNILAKIIFPLLLCQILANELTIFKQKMEEKVRNLTIGITDAYSLRCQNKIVNCDIKSYNQCEGTFRRKCFDDFPKPTDCTRGGAFLSYESAIRFPDYIQNETLLSAEDRQFICLSTELEETFQLLDTDRNSQYTTAYIATTSDIFRQYPANSSCGPQKLEERHWYMSAASGGKNVVIIVDHTQGMEEQLITMKSAVKSIINTFSKDDFINVIAIGENQTSIGQQKIASATNAVRQQLIDGIDKLEAGGSQGYEQAIRMAFNIFDIAENQSYGAQCSDTQNMLLLFTDISATNTTESLVPLIDGLNQGINITMFTFGIGSRVNQTLLKEASCAFNGIYIQIPVGKYENYQLKEIMSQYHTYIANGVNRQDPVWTQPYNDQTYGQIVTVSMPFYLTVDNAKKVIGVAAIDVVWSTFEDMGYNESYVMQVLSSQPSCFSSTLQSCQVELIRPSYARCDVEKCSLVASFPLCSKNITQDIFATTPFETNDVICCQFNEGIIIGAVIGGILVLCLLVTCIFAIGGHIQDSIRRSKKQALGKGSDTRMKMQDEMN